MKRKFMLAAMAAVALALPLSVTTPNSAESGSWVRVSGICAQAEECEKADDYICSKEDGDKIGEKCSKGCETELQ